MNQGRYDSAAAAMEMSNALNPESPGILAHLGLVYVYMNREDDAEKAFLEAIGIDTNYFEPIIALARLYQKRGDQANYLSWLERAVYKERADGMLAIEFGDQCLREGDFAKASTAFQRALARGADSATISQRMESYPDLVPYMRP
jgi:tetratricopeptide (TPR) repeat protein